MASFTHFYMLAGWLVAVRAAAGDDDDNDDENGMRFVLFIKRI